ncbi:hypothetical protein ACNKHN_01880 [Shigella flexneri]
MRRVYFGRKASGGKIEVLVERVSTTNATLRMLGLEKRKTWRRTAVGR